MVSSPVLTNSKLIACPATRVEVENTRAATNTHTKDNDVVMAEANVAPEANVVPEVNAPEANAAPESNPQLEDKASAPVPPPRPHTIEQAFYQGQLTTIHWPILVPPPAAGPQFDYHVDHMPQVQKPKPRLPRFPGTATSPRYFSENGFITHNTFFDSAKNPYSKPRISSDWFWSYQQRS